jgi:DNA-binding beta-propeller fold protein YncE
MAIDTEGNVFESNYHMILKITPTGRVTTLARSPGLVGSKDGVGKAARFNCAASIAVDASDNIYVADTRNHTIRKGVPTNAKPQIPA